MDNIHLVGHSLGAHVVGFMSKKVQGLGLGKPRRLTGLDPAYPFFELAGQEDRVDRSDADLVQIVHTNSGIILDGCLSFKVGVQNKGMGKDDIYRGRWAMLISTQLAGLTSLAVLTSASSTATTSPSMTCSRGAAATAVPTTTSRRASWG